MWKCAPGGGATFNVEVCIRRAILNVEVCTSGQYLQGQVCKSGKYLTQGSHTIARKLCTP